MDGRSSCPDVEMEKEMTETMEELEKDSGVEQSLASRTREYPNSPSGGESEDDHTDRCVKELQVEVGDMKKPLAEDVEDENSREQPVDASKERPSTSEGSSAHLGLNTGIEVIMKDESLEVDEEDKSEPSTVSKAEEFANKTTDGESEEENWDCSLSEFQGEIEEMMKNIGEETGRQKDDKRSLASESEEYSRLSPYEDSKVDTTDSDEEEFQEELEGVAQEAEDKNNTDHFSGSSMDYLYSLSGVDSEEDIACFQEEMMRKYMADGGDGEDKMENSVMSSSGGYSFIPCAVESEEERSPCTKGDLLEDAEDIPGQEKKEPNTEKSTVFRKDRPIAPCGEEHEEDNSACLEERLQKEFEMERDEESAASSKGYSWSPSSNVSGENANSEWVLNEFREDADDAMKDGVREADQETEDEEHVGSEGKEYLQPSSREDYNKKNGTRQTIACQNEFEDVGEEMEDKSNIKPVSADEYSRTSTFLTSSEEDETESSCCFEVEVPEDVDGITEDTAGVVERVDKKRQCTGTEGEQQIYPPWNEDSEEESSARLNEVDQLETESLSKCTEEGITDDASSQELSTSDFSKEFEDDHLAGPKGHFGEELEESDQGHEDQHSTEYLDTEKEIFTAPDEEFQDKNDCMDEVTEEEDHAQRSVTLDKEVIDSPTREDSSNLEVEFSKDMNEMMKATAGEAEEENMAMQFITSWNGSYLYTSCLEKAEGEDLTCPEKEFEEGASRATASLDEYRERWKLRDDSEGSTSRFKLFGAFEDQLWQKQRESAENRKKIQSRKQDLQRDTETEENTFGRLVELLSSHCEEEHSIKLNHKEEFNDVKPCEQKGAEKIGSLTCENKHLAFESKALEASGKDPENLEGEVRFHGLDGKSETQMKPISLETLYHNTEAGDKTVSSMQDEVKRLSSDLQDKQSNMVGVRTKCDDVFLPQQRGEQNLQSLISGNQLITASRKLEGDPEVAVHERRLASKQPQEVKDGTETDQEMWKLGKARLPTAGEERQMRSDDFSLTTFALEERQQDTRTKNSTVSDLHRKVEQLSSALQEEQWVTCRLRKEYDDAHSGQQREKERVDSLIWENQQLVFEITRLQGHLETAEYERQNTLKQLQEAREDHENPREDNAQINEVFKKLQLKDTEVSEKALAEISAKDQTITLLKDRVEQLSSDLQGEQSISRALQRGYDEVLSGKQGGTEKIHNLTHENLQLVSENTRLQDELGVARDEKEVAVRHLQEAMEAFTMDQENLKEEKAQIQSAYEKLQLEAKELFEKTAFLEELQQDVDNNDRSFSDLHHKVERLSSALREEQSMTTRLQREYDEVFSSWQEGTEKIHNLTHENLQLVSENKRLQDELGLARNEREVAVRQLQEAMEAFTVYQEKVRIQSADEKLQLEAKELSEKKLQPETETEDSTFSDLHHKVERLSSALHEEQCVTCRLQKEYDEDLSGQQREKERVDTLIWENQQQVSENLRVQGHPEPVDCLQQFQEAGEASCKEPENLREEKLQLHGFCAELQSEDTELSLHDTAEETSSDLRGEQSIGSTLQRGYDEVFSGKQEEIEEVYHENLRLVCENTGLQGHLESAEYERWYALEKLQEVAEASCKDRESLKEEMAQIHGVCEKLQRKDKEKTLALSKLEQEVHAKDHSVSLLQDRVKELSSALREEQSITSTLWREHDEDISGKQEGTEEIHKLTHENLQLVSENTRLQDELGVARNETEVALKQLEEVRETCGKDQEHFQLEKANFRSTNEELRSQVSELSEKVAALQKFQQDLETNEKTMLALKDKVEHLSRDLTEEQSKTCRLQKENDHAILYQKKAEEKIQSVTCENHGLVSENTRLLGDLQTALKHLREAKDSCNKNQKELEEERAVFQREHEQLKVQIKDLSEKTLALEKHQRETKEKTVSELQDTVERLSCDLMEQRSRMCQLQKDYDDAFLCEQKHREKIQGLTCENQQLVSKTTELQFELRTSLNEAQVALKQLQDARDASGKDREDLKEEKARFESAREKLQLQAGELSEKTLALEKLEKDLETKDNVVSSLHDEIMQLSSGLKEEQVNTRRLQKENDDAFAYRQKVEETIRSLICVNQQQTSQNTRLQEDLGAALNEMHIALKKLQDEREASGKNRRDLEEEKARFHRMYEELQTQAKELSEKTSALEDLQEALEAKGNAALLRNEREQRFSSSLKKERSNTSQFQSEYDNAFFNQQQRAKNKPTVTPENQQLASESNGQRGNLGILQKERQFAPQLLQEAEEPRSKDLEDTEKDAARSRSTNEKPQVPVEKIEQDIQVKESTISSLRDKVKQLLSDLGREQSKMRRLQSEYKEALQWHQKREAEPSTFTCENQNPASENTRTQGELSPETCSKEEEDSREEEAWFPSADQDQQVQPKELSEKTLAIKMFQQAKKSKDKTMHLLQEKAHQLSTNLREAVSTMSNLQRDYEDTFLDRKKGADKFSSLICANQQLTSENARLQDELEVALAERQIARKRLQEAIEASEKDHEDFKVEQLQASELSEKTLALEKLQRDCETKESTLLELQDKVEQLSSELVEEQSNACRLQKENSDVRLCHQKAEEKIQSVTFENRQLVSENVKLQGDLQAALHEMHVAVKDLQEAREASKKDQEDLREEGARLKDACEKLQIQAGELSQKTLDLERLRNDIENKDNIISTVQEKVTKLMTDLDEERSDACRLRMEYDDVFLCRQNGEKKIEMLSGENQQLFSENTRLRVDLEAALGERRIALDQLQEAKEASRKDQEDLKEEKARFQGAYEKLQTTTKEHSDKTRALEKLREDMESKDNAVSSLRREVEQLSADLRERQSSVDRLQKKCDDAAEKLDGLTCENQQLVSEKTRLREDLETTLGEWQNALKQLQEARDVHSREREKFGEERTRLQGTYEKQAIEISERSRALEKLHRDIEIKDDVISSLREKVKQLSSDLEGERSTVCQLRRKCDDVSSLRSLTCNNEKLASDNTRLQGELQVALSEKEIAVKQLQEAREARLGDQKTVKTEKARLQSAQNKLKAQAKEISEKTRDLKKLQRDIEIKDSGLSLMQEKVRQFSSDLKEEQSNVCRLRREYDDVVSRQKKGAERLDTLTCQNQQLASENAGLQRDIDAVLHERRVTLKQLQDAEETCRRKRKAVKREKARFKSAYEKLQMQAKELSEKTLALEKSRTAEECLRSALKNKQKCFEQMVSQKKTATDPLAIPASRRREDTVSSDHLRYDMHTLRMENAGLLAKLKAMEAKNVRIKMKYGSLSDRHLELTKKNNICGNQAAVAKLQGMVDEFKVRQSLSNEKLDELEKALKAEQTRTFKLEQKADQIGDALQKVMTLCEKNRVELKEALAKQIQLTEERQKLVAALKKAQDRNSRLEEQQRTEAAILFRQLADTEFKLGQQTLALDESRRALRRLQEEFTDLRWRHNNLNSEHHELLKHHSGRQVRPESFRGT